SIFWVFTGWTGDLTGSAASNSVAVGQPRSIVARFALNWALITAISTVIVIVAVTATVFLVRRKRRARPPPFPPIPRGPPVPASLLSGGEADRGPFRELPTDGTGRVVVLDLATTPARSGQDAIPQGQEAHLAVMDRRIVGEACAHLSSIPTGGVADLVALHSG